MTSPLFIHIKKLNSTKIKNGCHCHCSMVQHR